MTTTTPLALCAPAPHHRLRPATPTDAEALLADCWLGRPLSAAQWVLERMARTHREQRGVALVAEGTTGGLVGYGQVMLWPRCAEVSDLIVAGHCRGQGVGTALIQALVGRALGWHAPCIEIGAALGNPGALRLYRRLGFRDERTLDVNLGHGPEPVVFLRLPLG